MNIVILTKSSKNSGYCVAGINIGNGHWVRLISDDKNSHGALFNKNIQYADGSCCNILDVVEVPIIKEMPHEYQPENILIDNDTCWQKRCKYTLHDVLKLHSPEIHQYIFGDKRHFITEDDIRNIGHSLELITVEKLVITIPEDRSKAVFEYNSVNYSKISVTDPEFFKIPNGSVINKAILVMSLPDATFDGKYFKFIAKIFPLK